MKLKQPKEPVLPIAKTNQVVMFVRTRRFDTQLDALDIQVARIEKWCKEQNLDVVLKITASDKDINNQLNKALHYARDYAGRVVVASPCRICYDTVELLKLRKNLIAPLVIIDYDNLAYCGEVVESLDFMLTVQMAISQKYYEECKLWVK